MSKKTDDILFAEDSKPTKHKKRDPFKVTSGLSKNSKKQISQDLFSDISFDTNEQKTSSPNPAQSNTTKIFFVPDSITPEELLKQFPNLNKYVILTTPHDFSLSEEEQRKQIILSVQQQLFGLKDISLKFVDQQDNINKNKQKYISKIKGLQTSRYSHITPREKAIRALKYELKLQFQKLHENYLDDLSQNTNYIMLLANSLQKFRPDTDIRINTNIFLQEVQNFPRNSKEAMKVSQEIEAMKNYINQTYGKVQPAKVGLKLQGILSKCDLIFDQKYSYFCDTGDIEGEFQKTIKLMSTDFQQNLNKRINDVILNPSQSGEILVNLSNDLIKVHKLNKNNLPYLFMLNARLFFSSIYQTQISTYISHFEKTAEFSRRLTLMRHLTPIGLGISKRFIPYMLSSVPIYSFPPDHPYSKAVSLFYALEFQYCPIDFCMAVHNALYEVQQVASELSFKAETEEKKQTIAKGDHLLCLDDLCDVFLLCLILAAPPDTYALISAFEPYIPGLQLTSELDFAFTNIHATFSHIMEMDMDQFMADAKKRTDIDQEIDPLNIQH